MNGRTDTFTPFRSLKKIEQVGDIDRFLVCIEKKNAGQLVTNSTTKVFLYYLKLSSSFFRESWSRHSAATTNHLQNVELNR